jgi:hypothetical protein
MLKKNRPLIAALSTTIPVAVIAVICLGFCGFASWQAGRIALLLYVVAGMSDYDPKEAAIDQTRQYVEASYIHSQKPTPAENPVSPGYEWPHRCWELLHKPAIESSNQYTLKVTYYNWKDGGSFGASGADEITVLVDFANGSQVVSYFRAGTVKFCYPPDELNDDSK